MSSKKSSKQNSRIDDKDSTIIIKNSGVLEAITINLYCLDDDIKIKKVNNDTTFSKSYLAQSINFTCLY